MSTSLKAFWSLAMLLLASSALAQPFTMSYSGRLTDGTGKPVQGPIDVDVRFYDSVSSTNATTISAPAKLHFEDVMPIDGLILLKFDFSDVDFHTLFDGQAETWIEISAGDKTYPRQTFGAVPYALKVPVDGDTLEYDATTGALKIKAIPANVPVEGLLGKAIIGDITAPATDGKVVKWLATGGPGGTGAFVLSPDNNTGTLGTGDVTSNTIADGTIVNVDVSAAAAIDPSKIAGGTNVSSTEFGYLDTVSSNIQTQLDAHTTAIGGKAATGHAHAASDITSGQLAVAQGGTGTNLALASGGFLKQTVAGGNVTVGAITGADLPAAVRSSLDASDGNPAQAVQVDATGNVGIGTTSPQASTATRKVLELEGTGATDDPTIRIEGPNGVAFEAIGYGSAGSAANRAAYVGTTSNHSVHLMANSAVAATIAADGNVGVGTVTPGYKLQVVGAGDDVLTGSIQAKNTADTSAAAAHVSVVSGTTDAAAGYFGAFSSSYGFAPFADRVVVAANSNATGLTLSASAAGQDVRILTGAAATERVRIDDTGMVGIGTTVPGAKLEINSGALRLKNAAAGYLDISPEAGAGTATYTFPTSGQVNGYVLKTNGSGTLSWGADSTGGAPAFNSIAAGTNTTAAMVVGSGASLVTSGTGSIEATTIKGSTATFPTSGVIVTEAGTQTLTNKTLTSPTITGGTVEASKFKGSGTTTDAVDLATAEVAGQLAAANGGTGVNSTATFPTSGVIVTEAGTQTLTNKTLTSPTITGGSVEATIVKGSGSTTDAVDLATAEAAGILTLAKGGTGANLAATGGAGQFLKQSTNGGNVTVGTISASDLPAAIRSSLDASDGSPTDALKVDASGHVGIGTIGPSIGVSMAPATRVLGVAGDGSLESAGSNGALVLGNIRTTATAGDKTGMIAFSSLNNAGSTKQAAGIEGYLEGTGGANGLGGFLVFQTKPDNSTTLTENMRIAADGKVGIGTSTLNAKLHVKAASGAAGQFERNSVNGVGAAAVIGMQSDAKTVNDSLVLPYNMLNASDAVKNYGQVGVTIDDATAGSEDASFHWSSITAGAQTEKMRLTTNGYLGLGNVAPVTMLSNSATAVQDAGAVGATPSGLTWVSGSGAGYAAAIANTSSVAGRNGLLVKTTQADSSTYLAKFESNATNRMTIRADGFVGINTTAPTGTLDVKAVVTTITGSAATVNGSQTITGTGTLFTTELQVGQTVFINGGTHHIIAIASNTSMTVYPAAIFTNSGYTVQRMDPPIQATDPNGSHALWVGGDGYVGVGTSLPAAKLDVAGQIRSQVYDNGSGTAIDWTRGNVQYTSASCGAMTFANMLEGGSYSLIVTGGTPGTCTFSQTVPDTLTNATNFKYSPTNGNTTSSKSTVYSFLRAGNIVYVSWIAGF